MRQSIIKMETEFWKMEVRRGVGVLTIEGRMRVSNRRGGWYREMRMSIMVVGVMMVMVIRTR